MVIDRGKEVCQNLIDSESIKIELGEKGSAVILYREYRREEYKQVDRETGEYHPYPEENFLLYPYTNSITPESLRYYNILAKQMEGKKVVYLPTPLTLDVCEDIYQRALKIGVIRIRQNPDEGTLFQYVLPEAHLGPIYLHANYGKMNLEENTVDASTIYHNRTRPIHSDFANFLKLKKAELDS